MKKTPLDFAVVNVAVSKGKDIKISLGARPSISVLAKKAMEFINKEKSITKEVIQKSSVFFISLGFNDFNRLQTVFVYKRRGSIVHRTNVWPRFNSWCANEIWNGLRIEF